ncbi:hypothetical protein CLI64_17385 [Nostoc sp. CENA543]|uniref:beta-1,6-N-acetylglucosaminyltransferase n=1 Tax=Nostoc sp. CENA543 TaxID=1869241 RepID=UPI000CA179D9|nr:beta-1,6-N-acetylglucosaminyltransferase [Nostoc sp. CENA543]AUT02014.1 hypothetical protein CLI64_17385 [Nostoc sp. CENA543]
MKIAYIILAHKLPQQLVRLIYRLNDDSATFFLHIDGKVNDKVYSDIVNQVQNMPNVYLLKRYKCYWGKIDIVKATIEGIRQLINHNVEFDYAILLSGQDYPIKPITQIKNFLHERRGHEFIESFSLKQDNKWTYQDGCYQSLNRVKHWHFHFRSKHFYLPIERKFIPGLEPFGGSQWWCLSKECIYYINNFLLKNPDYINYFRYVFIPDELFFQTIISNSPFGAIIFNDDLRYVDWENPNPTPPAVLDKSYFEELVSSPKFFARKFDMSRNVEILNLIDQAILGISDN